MDIWQREIYLQTQLSFELKAQLLYFHSCAQCHVQAASISEICYLCVCVFLSPLNCSKLDSIRSPLRCFLTTNKKNRLQFKERGIKNPLCKSNKTGRSQEQRAVGGSFFYFDFPLFKKKTTEISLYND